MKNVKILVDGANIAFFIKNERKKAQLYTLEILIEYLEDIKNLYKMDYQIVADASLKYRIDDKSRLEDYYNCGKIIECPKGVKADDFIIEYAVRYPDSTIIISNDCFKEYDTSNLTILKFGLIFNDVVLKPDLYELICESNLIELKMGDVIESI